MDRHAIGLMICLVGLVLGVVKLMVMYLAHIKEESAGRVKLLPFLRLCRRIGFSSDERPLLKCVDWEGW